MPDKPAPGESLPDEPLAVGAAAPDFALKDQNDQVVRLSDLRGRRVIVAFHPLAWTNVCKLQMQDLEARKPRLDALGALAVGISVDSRPCKKAWGEAIGVKETALLADFWPHGAVAQAFGVFFSEFGFSRRAAFIVGEDGSIIWQKVYPTHIRPDIDEIMKALEEGRAQ